jgi:hypothetical protein
MVRTFRSTASIAVAISSITFGYGCGSADETAADGETDTGLIPDTSGDAGQPDAATDAAVQLDTADDVTDVELGDAPALGDTSEPLDTELDTATDTDAPDASDIAADVVECNAVEAAADALGVIDAVATGTVESTTTDGLITLVIDASAGGPAEAANNPYIYVALDGTKVELTDSEALESGDWVVAAKRTTVRVNGGDSGPGGWLVTRVDGTAFDALVAPPGRDAVWVTDDFISETCEVVTEGRDTIRTAIGQWYDYDPSTHAVTPTADLTYVLYHPATHAAYKLALTAWSGGYLTVQWQAL